VPEPDFEYDFIIKNPLTGQEEVVSAFNKELEGKFKYEL
jgi:hypothetical protein